MIRGASQRIYRIVGSIVLVFLLAIAAAATSLIWQQRNRAIGDSASQASRFVTGAVAALNRSLVHIDVLLSSLDETQSLRMLQPDAIDRAATSQVMRTIVQRNLMLRRLALIDAQSRVLASSDKLAPEQINLPVDFTARALHANVAALTISPPQQDASGAEPVIYLARHIKLGDGSKILAVAEVLMIHLNTILLQGADIEGLEVTLERDDGTVLASDPVQDRVLGQVLPLALHKGTAGIAQRQPARLSRQDALVVAQPILYDDVLVVASIPIAAALAKWQHERTFIVIVATLFALMVAAAGALAGWYWVRLAQARQDIKKSKANIEQLAFFDYLTNLPNRLLLMDRLAHAMASSTRSKQFGALFFMDLDNFKTINDTLGHDVGDMLLKHVATRLQQSVRQADTVARFGGDEFIVLLENLSVSEPEAAELARRIGEKILAALNLPFESRWQNFKTSASIGAALFGGHIALNSAELLKQADIAMYQSKALGRNKLSFFDPQMQASITAHSRLEADLQIAIEHQQFTLYYQPQVNGVGDVLGAEVLIRWFHPQRGMVPPFEFIPIAEESDLINQIGLWVLRTACAQLKLWQQAPRTAHLQLAVNVSARQFRQEDFVAVVRAAITESAVAPAGLKLELTESLVLEDVRDTVEKMNAVRQLGVRFSMDDFGTGQSSLSYLTHLPLDQLKIDQSFVRNIGITPSDGMIVQTIIGMARNLSLEVIAEGVETRAQEAFLAQNGCTLFQGYLFGKPCPIAEFEQLLRTTESAH